MRVILLAFPYALAFLLGGTASGQSPLADTAATVYYVPQLSSQLYNGSEYASLIATNMVGHQFFLTNQEQTGSLQYNDGFYPNVPLLYDIYRDQVIVLHPVTAMRVRLVPEKISSFTINNHSFIRLPANADGTITPGFYEVLLDGAIQLVAKRTKRLQEARGKQVTRSFEDIPSLYIGINRAYYKITTQNSLLKHFKADRSALAEYGKSHRLEFTKQTREQDALAIIRYYQTIAH